ncbi:MAG: hypothetical protein JW871_03445 [Endomicrobiales bacterium]|nr:hypothetical protein [Endomicrobiales bacterium]
MKKRFFIAVSMLLIAASLWSESSTVSIVKDSGEWKLKVNGRDFYIKGVGLGVEVEKGTIDKHMREIQFLGANSVRTWGIGKSDGILLDIAEKYDVMVDLGIWLQQNGYMDFVKDKNGKARTLEEIKKHVMKHKNHPALLMWNVGNEVVSSLPTEKEKIAFARYLEKICQMIHKEDPNHPVVYTSIMTCAWPYLKKYTPSIDLYAANAYAGLPYIDSAWEQGNYPVPYIITEFGTAGPWEVGKDSNGFAIEPDDHEKGQWYGGSFTNHIEANKGNNLGGYAFLFGDKQDFGGMWHGLFINGLRRPHFWALRNAYSGKPPSNDAPKLESVALGWKKINGSVKICAILDVSDPEDEKLSYNLWVFNEDIWGYNIEEQKVDVIGTGRLTFDPFGNKGPYKLYFGVRDESGNISVKSTSWSGVIEDLREMHEPDFR